MSCGDTHRKASSAVFESQRTYSPLGRAFVTESDSRLAVIVEYTLPLHDLWFTRPEFRTSLLNLLVNAMRRMIIDGSHVLAAIAPIVR